MNGALRTERWPMPACSLRREPRFLFVLTPPYSGSTALTQVLTTAPGAMLLHPRGEGFQLVPAMLEEDRWDPAKPVRWESVRACWLRRIEEEERQRGEIALVVEKSPPNMMRLPGLRQAFPEHDLMAFNRDPYAFCASAIHRKLARNQPRKPFLESWVKRWLTFSGVLRGHIDGLGLPWFRYESFCADPGRHADLLAQRLPALQGIDVARPLKVKDYAPQPLADQNARQIATLSADDREIIAQGLRAQEALVRSFGYSPEPPAAAAPAPAPAAPDLSASGFAP